jgi:hypothetical protein
MSVDGGEAWNNISEGLPVSRVTALVIDPSDPSLVYAGTAGASIFKRRFKIPLISSAALDSSTTLTISGRNFGASPRVLVNDSDLTDLLISATDSSIRLKGQASKLKIKKGENTLQVVGPNGTTSNVFILSPQSK